MHTYSNGCSLNFGGALYATDSPNVTIQECSFSNNDAATSTGYAAYAYGGAITIVNRMLHENTVHSEIGLSQVLFMEVCGSLKNKSESNLLEALYLISFTVLFLTTAHIFGTDTSYGVYGASGGAVLAESHAIVSINNTRFT